MTGPPSWSTDGFIYMGNTAGTGFRRVPENGGEPEVFAIDDLPEGVRVFDATRLPGTELVLLGTFHGGLSTPGPVGVYSLDSGTYDQLVDAGLSPKWINTGHLMWTREDVVYAAAWDLGSGDLSGRPVPVLQGVQTDFAGVAQYAVSDEGTLVYVPGGAFVGLNQPRELVWIDADGTVTPASSRREPYWRPLLSPDGNRVAVSLQAAASERRDGCLDPGPPARLSHPALVWWGCRSRSGRPTGNGSISVREPMGKRVSGVAGRTSPEVQSWSSRRNVR